MNWRRPTKNDLAYLGNLEDTAMLSEVRLLNGEALLIAESSKLTIIMSSGDGDVATFNCDIASPQYIAQLINWNKISYRDPLHEWFSNFRKLYQESNV